MTEEARGSDTRSELLKTINSQLDLMRAYISGEEVDLIAPVHEGTATGDCQSQKIRVRYEHVLGATGVLNHTLAGLFVCGNKVEAYRLYREHKRLRRHCDEVYEVRKV